MLYKDTLDDSLFPFCSCMQPKGRTKLWFILRVSHLALSSVTTALLLASGYEQQYKLTVENFHTQSYPSTSTQTLLPNLLEDYLVCCLTAYWVDLLGLTKFEVPLFLQTKDLRILVGFSDDQVMQCYSYFEDPLPVLCLSFFA